MLDGTYLVESWISFIWIPQFHGTLALRVSLKMSDFQLTEDMFYVNMAQSHWFFSKSYTHQSVCECKNFTNVLLIYVFYMVRLHCELFLGFTPFISTTSWFPSFPGMTQSYYLMLQRTFLPQTKMFNVSHSIPKAWWECFSQKL